MSIRHLDALFRPHSISVIVASDLTPSATTAALLIERLTHGGYKGKVDRIALSTKHGSLREATEDNAPSLALICTPAEDWPRVIDTLAAQGNGARAAILFGDPVKTAPLPFKYEDAQAAPSGAHTDVAVDTRAATHPLLTLARPGLLRILGPASAGVIASRSGVHASIGNEVVLPGRVALISQSRSFANAVISWASARDIGFSKVVTTGLEWDIDAADLLDYLASDPETGAIALALDFVAPQSMRKFMSAARAASRNKPVLVLRARHQRDDDALFSAAFRRAGMVRVNSIEDLLDAIETLHIGRFAGNGNVTIVSNGGFTGALAADEVIASGNRLAPLSDEAIDTLDKALNSVSATVSGSVSANVTTGAPASASAGTATSAAAALSKPFKLSNPINLGETADIARYGATIQALAPLSTTGALFIVHTPSDHAPALPLAQHVVDLTQQWPRALMSCWLGDFDPQVRALLHRNKIAVYPTPQRLARAFARMREYQRNHVLLAETPESTGHVDISKIAAFRQALVTAMTQTQADAAIAPDSALSMMRALLELPQSSEAAAHNDAGPTMDIIVKRETGFGMVLGVTPVAAFPTRQVPETEWAILPISTVLSGDLVSRLPSAPAHGHASHRAYTRFLARLSDIIVATPEIATVRLTAAYIHNAIVLRAAGVTVASEDELVRPYRFAVRPYPAELETTMAWLDETITIRPIRPQDEATHLAFIESLSEDDMRMRFFGAVRVPEHSQLARMTQIDYDREMAFIATTLDANQASLTLGVVRAVADPDNDTAEFAVVVRSDRKGLHLGGLLMRRIIEYCRARGTRVVMGEVLSDNTRMVKLARRLGFEVRRSDEPGVLSLSLTL